MCIRDRYMGIVAAKRTAIGSFMGKLARTRPIDLAAVPIKGAIDSIKLHGHKIDEVILGNALSAGLGQNPARQVALTAGIPINIPATLVNKADASGIKSVTLAVQSIAAGYSDVIVAGGFDTMSQAPYYLMNHRRGFPFGNESLIDGLAFDGLTDSINNCALGLCAEKTVSDLKMDRAIQDDYTMQSYDRAISAIKDGKFIDEIVPVQVGEKEMFSEDEEYKKYQHEKIQALKPVFSKNGTITSANTAKINDGACALILMAEETAKAMNLRPLARVKSFAEIEVQPMEFSLAASKAVQLCLERAGVRIGDVDFHEINETFASVVLANMKLLDLDLERVNVHGGALSLGNPLGMSGARLIISLINVLKRNKGRLGVASICNGGGGGTAVLLENLSQKKLAYNSRMTQTFYLIFENSFSTNPIVITC
eukprot:TRINITY_DN12995_c0_g1_i1.p1 TRINITY_DN12995_c0_g1~~TRINITY_DN12995_c0_g1_i1.p1  ORF type:complete len:425 (+),score=88.40 TRINITY_DN12995_c0_g1_i1:64-1338(+)